MLKIIKYLFFKILFSFILLYFYNYFFSNLLFIIPINLYTVIFISLFDWIGIILLILFKIFLL
ncbi:MAG: pro-sigmaK processing inhibitor BofA family protein [Bacilli bacterium]|nr:pro-sigmaK processing inhibitor BofA family protein [Bacilli bacterium]